MTKDEAVQKLSKVARISVAYAEDLYDSFFEKPVVPQYVADWYEENKKDYDYELWDYLSSWKDQKKDDFKKWIEESYGSDKPIITLVNMHQFGYEVEKEPRYMVRVKGISGNNSYLNQEDGEDFLFADSEEFGDFRAKFTRKELEEANFGWVFDCPGVEVKEVTNE